MATRKPSRKTKTIVLVAVPDARLLNVAGPSDVFTMASKIKDPADPPYRVLLASATRSRQVVTASGVTVLCEMSAMEIDFPIDTLIVGGTSPKIPPAFYEWLRAQYGDVQRMGSVCAGAFSLARAGLLDGRNATTHWEVCGKLAAEFPTVQVDSSPFYVKDGKIYTSGGVTSGIDLALGMVEEDLGHELALQVARRLVLHLRRPGGQLQYGHLLPGFEQESPLAGRVHQWLRKHIAEEVKVEMMAAKVSMSPRNFARVFLRETKMTPAKYLEKLRVDMARQYLEDSDLSMEQIAEKCGLGGLVSMRRTFMRHLKISPSYYRSTFRKSFAAAEQL
ncbi:AraC family transcriptional regulator [Chitinophaga parva]|uniref:AraC family transcriptional regulator n=1 Tax=Chitinophaga parva TaxID=2169414 RepID=A0A2T7BK92_9BACT|nr:GlxA family transcriptional regulator [Chitinophaga parva]PUZ28082.1 AraC family transcriptional regulator [Chitinophaga parva]